MCSYSILCCIPFVCDVSGYCSGRAVTILCVVYRLCGMLLVIIVDVKIQCFVLCNVCVGCWWLFWWLYSYIIMCRVPFVLDVSGYCSGCAVTVFCAV
jgi:hypothetical protein